MENKKRPVNTMTDYVDNKCNNYVMSVKFYNRVLFPDVCQMSC